MRVVVVGLVVGITALISACTEPQEPAEAREPKSTPLSFGAPAHAIMALDNPVAFSLSPDGSEMAWIQPLIGGSHEYRVAPVGRPEEAVAYTHSSAGLVWTERTGLITGTYPPVVFRPGTAAVRHQTISDVMRPIRTADRIERGIHASSYNRKPYLNYGAITVTTHGRGLPTKRVRYVPASNRDRIVTREIGLFDTATTVLPLSRHELVVVTRRQESPDSTVTSWLHHGFGDAIPLGRALAPDLTLIPGRPADSTSSVYAYRHDEAGGRQLVRLDLETRDETAIELDVSPDALHGHFSDRDQILTYVYERPGQPWPVPLTEDAGRALELAVAHDLANRSDLSFTAVSISKASRRYVFRRVRADGRLRFTLVDLVNETASEFQFQDMERPLISVDILDVTAPDGLTVPAFLFRPASDASNRPLVVALHGGPMQHDLATPDATHSMFLDYGLDVLTLNYRGSTGHGSVHERAGDLEFDRGMIDDINAAITEALIVSGRAADAPVILYGHSFGGHLAFAAARSAQHRYCAAIVQNPGSDLVEFQRLGWPYLGGPWIENWRQVYGSWHDDEAAARLTAASAVTRPDDWTTPVAVIAGEYDVITPERMVAELADIYAEDLFTPYQVIPIEGHTISAAVFAPVLNDTLDAALAGPCRVN